MTITIQKTIDFIKSYRNMEKGTLANARAIIAKLSVDHQHDHILKEIPEVDKQYGNSANWGDYILSLKNDKALEILTSILNRLNPA